MARPETLRPESLKAAIAGSEAMLYARGGQVCLSSRGRALPGLAGASVLLRTHSQLAAALGLIALDGVARRIVIAPPDVKAGHLASVIARADVEAVMGEDESLAIEGARFVPLDLSAVALAEGPQVVTEWVLFTSGTTGEPKMVAHTLAGLTGAIQPAAAADITWGTFYDIRRYGGLQILLRALLGHASLVLSDADEDVAGFLARLGRCGVTHLTGTPSHWRRALMSPANAAIAPHYVRLSGEIADQAILDSLKARFPDAAIGHAYASTEAGVGFEVTDGLEGFPASFIGRPGAVEMKVEDGRLHLRSARTASAYVGGGPDLRNDGWVDTGDVIEQRGGRFHFMGRAGGIINVGGLKINPEEVEAVINRQPGVRASRVSGRKSPITGAIVVAEVVLTEAANDNATFKEAILAACRENLPAFKVPAMLRFVPSLALTAAGKLSRNA
ncbi:MAG: AMP-binding protein [Alphaproteobacteria bacterium]|nr:AMP-binding protein [Alphaproteobacteria bacterium]